MRPFAALRMRGAAGGGGGGGPDHAYWRLSFDVSTTPGAAGGLDLNTLIFRTSPGGPQAAIGGVASANAGTAFPVQNAFDGNDATFWDSYENSGTFHWAIYMFAAPVEIVEYQLMTAFGIYMARSWLLQFSDDGSAWTTKDTRSGITWVDNVPQAFTVP